MATATIPSRLQSRYPSIGTTRTAPYGYEIYNSSTPLADWSGFHADMANGGFSPFKQPVAPGSAKDAFGNFVGSSAPFIKPLAVVKDPSGASAGDSLLAAFNKYSSNMPDLNSMIAGLKDRYTGAQSNVDQAYSDQQAALDPSGWESSRRALDAEMAGRTAGYEGQLGDLGNRYSNVLGNYENAGRGIVNNILSKGQDYIDTVIPQQTNSALGKALTYLDKYGIQTAGAGGGTGASSGGATLAGRAISDAVLPYMAQAQQMQQDLRRNVQLPFEGDIANRQTSKITGFDYPVASDIYNRYGQLNAQQRGTEDAIYGAKQAAAAGKVQSAIGQLMSAGMSVQQMAQVLQLPISLISQQAQALSQILQNRNVSTQFGVEDIRGANVTQPQGYPMNRPAPYRNSPQYPSAGPMLPDRYLQPNTATGNAGYIAGAGQGTAPQAAANQWRDAQYTPQGAQQFFNYYGEWPPGYNAPSRYTSAAGNPGSNYGADTNSYFDPNYGRLVNWTDPNSSYYEE